MEMKYIRRKLFQHLTKENGYNSLGPTLLLISLILDKKKFQRYNIYTNTKIQTNIKSLKVQ